MQGLITTSQEWQDRGRTSEALWWIVERNPRYDSNQYDLVRNEIMLHPRDFTQRLDQGIIRIWMDIPNAHTSW